MYVTAGNFGRNFAIFADNPLIGGMSNFIPFKEQLGRQDSIKANVYCC
jgi:hypothetical protein